MRIERVERGREDQESHGTAVLVYHQAHMGYCGCGFTYLDRVLKGPGPVGPGICPCGFQAARGGLCSIEDLQRPKIPSMFFCGFVQMGLEFFTIAVYGNTCIPFFLTFSLLERCGLWGRFTAVGRFAVGVTKRGGLRCWVCGFA